MGLKVNAVLDQRKRPLHDLRISVTDRCNFRCGYCMPREVFGKNYKFLKQNQLLTFEEIQRLVRIFSGFGVSKIRLTGGEPLLRRDIELLVEMLADLEGISDVAMTTNASLLTRQRVRLLKEAGLDRLNISLDALDKDIYQKINEVNVPLADVLNGIEYALEANYKSIKVNMVVQKGINHKDILPMARHFRHSGVILRFIEFMDVGNHNDWSLDQVFTAGEIVNLIDKEFPLEPVEANYHGEVAKRWKYVDGGGELGVISSITQPFCGGCARARLSAVGELYTCLFATAGFDLRSLVRAGHDDETISQRIAQIWRQREDRYSEIRFTKDNKLTESSARQKVEMSYIGG
jgi:cyclic pyranopterin phosphate synthase